MLPPLVFLKVNFFGRDQQPAMRAATFRDGYALLQFEARAAVRTLVAVLEAGHNLALSASCRNARHCAGRRHCGPQLQVGAGAFTCWPRLESGLNEHLTTLK